MGIQRIRRSNISLMWDRKDSCSRNDTTFAKRTIFLRITSKTILQSQRDNITTIYGGKICRRYLKIADMTNINKGIFCRRSFSPIQRAELTIVCIYTDSNWKLLQFTYTFCKRWNKKRKLSLDPWFLPSFFKWT